jgi:hypothetical protein
MLGFLINICLLQAGTTYYVAPKNVVFWEVFTAVTMVDAFWEFVPCTSGLNRRFGEYFTSILRVPQDDRVPQLCYYVIVD